MNERIKELAQEAKQYARDLKRFGDDKLHEGMFSSADFEKKFAELIVKECINICNGRASKGDSALLCVKDIKEHFGVK